jgi:hypothetical protein
MEALKGPKELVGIGHVKACPIIPDEHHQCPVRFDELAHLNARLGTLGRELPGIAQQIF